MSQHKSAEKIQAQARGEASLPAHGSNVAEVIRGHVGELERLIGERQKINTQIKKRKRLIKQDGFKVQAVEETIKRRNEPVEATNMRKEKESDIAQYTKYCAELPLFEWEEEEEMD